MIKSIHKIFVFVAMVTFFTNGSFAQEVIEYRKKINEKLLPAIVEDNFVKKYREVMLEGWYETHLIHWHNDLHAEWYDEWYIERTMVIYTYDKPNYYEVEFIEYPGEYSRAIYNLHGYWHETRTQIKGLPKPIVESLQQTEYKDWNLSQHMEKMESPAWPYAIYRFHVKKGLRSHILSMDPQGNIVQTLVLVDGQD